MLATEFLGTRFLTKEEVPEPKTVTIRTIERERFERDGRIDVKPKFTLEEFDKQFLVNRTNLSTLLGIYAEDSMESWIGKSFVLYNDPSVMMAGRVVGGLRVRAVTSGELGSSYGSHTGGGLG